MKTLHEILAMAACCKRNLKEDRDEAVLQRICLICRIGVPTNKQYLLGNCATCNRRIERHEIALRARGKVDEAARFIAGLIREAKRLQPHEINEIKARHRLASAIGESDLKGAG